MERFDLSERPGVPGERVAKTVVAFDNLCPREWTWPGVFASFAGTKEVGAATPLRNNKAGEAFWILNRVEDDKRRK